MFAIYDANGDGYITEAEFVADGGTPSMFRELNGSGTDKLTKGRGDEERVHSQSGRGAIRRGRRES